jgi:hypothetical protein
MSQQLLDIIESNDASYEVSQDNENDSMLRVVKKIGGIRVQNEKSDMTFISLKLKDRNHIDRACLCLQVDILVQKL